MSPLSTASTPATYELLVSLLDECPQSIEILPGDGSAWVSTQNPADVASEPSFAPFLFVEGNLGIPQKILYNLYLHAVSVFKSARHCVPTQPTMMAQQNYHPDASLVRILTASSSVILLANPSHQTALNARKHLVRMDLLDPCAELRFMASLLSSQHCAKYAELWYHRRWLLSSSSDSKLSDAVRMDSDRHLHFSSQGALQEEFKLVSQACELYPRNYFAWTHRIKCVQSLLSDYLAGADTIGFVSIFRDEIAQIKGWIDRHVSDYSAIHTILALSHIAFRSGDLFLIDIVIGEDLLDHAISLVQEYPAHEALWMYVRAAFSLADPQQAQRIQQFREHFVQPLVHLQQSTAGMKEDLVKVSQYARWFLDRIVGCRLSQT